MNSKMLIDASHPEETRVVVVKGNRIEEFDFESDYKKQIKGNIYLAKVTRVEPSLQAAFVEYGGNRHGFLAFSEIHPDYYQIPVADRQALVEEDLARAKEEEEQEERKIMREHQPAPESAVAARTENDGESVSEDFEAGGSEAGEDEGASTSAAAADEVGTDASPVEELPLAEQQDADRPEDDGVETIEAREPGAEAPAGEAGGEEEATPVSTRPSGRRGRHRRHRQRGNGADGDTASDGEEETIEELGTQDAMEEVPSRAARPPRKQYKIQEVIKRRQILLVQVVKEERGNKGAALTTYLSLAGRYSVLMPNTARGGGISRKITNITDRKRLKDVVRDLEVPRGMGIILRTAGAMRTKAEVKRDYEYLMRLWDNVRTLTLASTAPSLVYEEGSLIKRSIRDLYNKDIDQILVAGETGYREAKDFMRMLLPSQAKVVQPYREAGSIFSRGGIEAQLDRMLQPHVTLKSGGYIILNQTEALVSIDVNSGRSTREHSVEDTAVQTNLEAAEEIARQLRLRDLAGLIVVDFIDMDEKRNNRAVEKRMKDCLKEDRARIQVGHISHFGLLEMSRQRIRASVLESTTQVCPTCAGMGFVRSNSSLALHVIRTIEEYLQKQSTHDILVKVPTPTALYVLNEKRVAINEIERLHGVHIAIQGDDAHGHQHVAIEQGAEAAPRPIKAEAVSLLTVAPEEFEPEAVLDDEAETVEVEAKEVEADAEEAGRKRRRRKRGGRQTEAQAETPVGEEAADAVAANEAVTGEFAPADGADASAEPASDDENGERKRRRRGRRGGAKRVAKGEDGSPESVVAEGGEADAADAASDAEAVIELPMEALPVPAEVPTQPDENVSEPEAATGEREEEPTPDIAAEATAPVVAEIEPEHEPASGQPEETIASSEPEAPKAPPLLEPVLTSNGEAEEAEKPKRTGWWARRSFF